MKCLSKDEALRLASRPDGLVIHIYKWTHAQRRKQLNRYKREGLLERKVLHDHFVFKKKESAE